MLLLLTRFLEPLHLTDAPTWESLRTQLVDRLDLPRLSLGLLGALASAGGYAVLMMTYMAFMVAERGPLSRKVSLVIPDSGERDAALALFRRINTQVVTYLSTKTLMNVILGTISWILMWMLGIENSVFWAFLIALFNYIPYVGSIAGVALASAYTAFAYGDLKLAGLALVVLSLAQFYVGNLLEPRVMGRTLNLSPLTVLLALVVWSTLWGVPGAIIAVPMTSILMIILSAFKRTRPVAILTSRDGNLLH